MPTPNLKFQSIPDFSCLSKAVATSLLFCMSMGSVQVHAAPADAVQESNSQSIELGNVDEPDSAADMPTSSIPAAAVLPAKTGVAEVAANAEKTEPKETAGAAVTKTPTATPMERYRDFKLQQAATPNAANPATGRRYLRVDRNTYLDSLGVQ